MSTLSYKVSVLLKSVKSSTCQFANKKNSLIATLKDALEKTAEFRSLEMKQFTVIKEERKTVQDIDKDIEFFKHKDKVAEGPIKTCPVFAG